jgi:hypothetical protein
MKRVVSLSSHPDTPQDAAKVLVQNQKDIEAYLSNRKYLDSTLKVRFCGPLGRELEVQPRAETFGVIRLADTTIVAYPKCLPPDFQTKERFDLLTYLALCNNELKPAFDLTRVEQELQRLEEFGDNFFDFYFHLIFT